MTAGTRRIAAGVAGLVGAVGGVGVVAGLGVVGGAGGCTAARPAAFAGPVQPGPFRVTADWDDLDAAIDLAAERMEMALVQATGDEPGSLLRRFELRTVAAEPVLLIVTREAPEPPEPGKPQQLTLSVKVGRFGSPQREAQFLHHLRRRLEQLQGVDFRPL